MPATKLAEAPAPAAAPVEARPVTVTPAPEPPAATEGAIAGNKDKDERKKPAPSASPALADESAPDVYLRRAEPAPPKPAAPAHHASAGKQAPPAKSTLGLDDSGVVYDVKMGPNTGVGRVTGNGNGNGAGGSGAPRGQASSAGGGELAGQLGGVTKGGSANYRDQQQAIAPRTRSVAPKSDSLDG